MHAYLIDPNETTIREIEIPATQDALAEALGASAPVVRRLGDYRLIVDAEAQADAFRLDVFTLQLPGADTTAHITGAALLQSGQPLDLARLESQVSFPQTLFGM